MASRALDRLLTIAVTATLTSAAWIVVGSIWVDPAPQGAPDGPGVEQARGIASSSRAATEQPIVPVPGVAPGELTDSFADARDEGERLHQAIDIMAPVGTPVVAAVPGTIERLYRSGAGGNTIYLRSADRRTIHYYAHLAEYAPGLREGQAVRRGQRLGAVGFTGNADPAAPHLHFAILRTTPDAGWSDPATALNPYPLLRDEGGGAN